MNQIGHTAETFRRVPVVRIDLGLAEGIPAALANRKGWVLWTDSPAKDWHVMPMGFATGTPRQWIDPLDEAEQLTLEDALHAATIYSDWDLGVGLVIGEDVALLDFADVPGFVTLATEALQ